jgi:chemosensory pili system protein ChpA (sensor histidine kinase/response regulator)
MSTALRDAIDYTTLGWIKPELDETLRQARIEIEAFADDPADVARMDACAGRLHQVQGTLRMVELYAPARVAEEMEQLAQALQEGRVEARDDACASLMRGAVLLPDYLERLQGGHKDIPVVLLPLLNELRAARGEPALGESVLFAPDLQRPLPESLPEDGTDEPVEGLLDRLDQALADWPRDGMPASYVPLSTAVDDLLGRARAEAAKRMLWVAASVAAALRDGALQTVPALHDAFAGVARESRRVFGDAPRAGRAEAVLEPTRELLYQVAHGGGDHPAHRELRETFELERQLQAPSESELAHAQGSLTGHNRALLDTVSGAIKDDLLRVKDALDLHLRSGQSDVSGLQPQVEALTTIGDTLGMLGLDGAREVVQGQRDTLDAMLHGSAPVDEGTLLDIAAALLFVDASLDEQVQSLGAPAGRPDDLLANESRKVTEALAREAIANFADARQSFVAFVETNWDHAELAEVPRLLGEVAGALQMLDLPQPAHYLAGVRAYTERELIGRRRVPSSRQLDTLADALASLEYYLEALREQRPNRDDILDVARNSLEALDYWPVPEAPAEPPPASTPVSRADEPEGQPGKGPDVDRAAAPGMLAAAETTPTAAEPPAPAGPAAPAPAIHAPAPVGTGDTGGFERTGDEIDDEIREIFLEEFEEEIGNLSTLLPAWRGNPEDLEQLRSIRRVFHTLKGSGRLVGAKVLGEFAWKIENALNRVLDGSRPPSPAVMALVDNAFDALPQLLSALRGHGGLVADLGAIESLADRVAAGEEAFLAPTRTGTTRVETTQATPDAGAIADAAPVAEGVPASVDAVLLEILDAEVDGHLVTVDQWLANVREAPAPASDALLRAIHTMNGAFAMTEVPAITQAMSPAEAYV